MSTETGCFSAARLASRKVGKSSPCEEWLRCHASANVPRSLSENDSTTKSPTDWPKSLGISFSSKPCRSTNKTCMCISHPAKTALIAGISRCSCSAITTSRPCFASPAVHIRSNWVRTRLPTACTRSRIGLPETTA